MLVRNQYALDVVVPTMHPILPWLAILDNKVAELVSHIAPEVLLEGGDPSGLPVDMRKRILRQVCDDTYVIAVRVAASSFSCVGKKNRWKIPDVATPVDFDGLVSALEKHWQKIAPHYPGIDHIGVIGIDLTQRSSRSTSRGSTNHRSSATKSEVFGSLTCFGRTDRPFKHNSPAASVAPLAKQSLGEEDSHWPPTRGRSQRRHLPVRRGYRTHGSSVSTSDWNLSIRLSMADWDSM